jgi:hypothetical protein
MPMRRFGDADDRDQPPEDLTSWLAAGLRRVDALSWRRWNFTLEQAVEWRSTGVSEALTAAQWQAAGVRPETVGGWLDAKIGASEAIRWHEFGFGLSQAREYTKKGDTPDDAYQQQRAYQQVLGQAGLSSAMPAGNQAHELLKAGVPRTVLRGYVEARWLDQDAASWGKLGIQAWDARAWRDIGLTAAETAELCAANPEATPMGIMREWWPTGIPFDELADWIGAGLSAAEAVAQRASGVTVEQAAALRALRRGGAL